MQRGAVYLDRSAATIVAVCRECPWRMVTAGYRRDSIAYAEAARHALAHGDDSAREAHTLYLRRRRSM